MACRVVWEPDLWVGESYKYLLWSEVWRNGHTISRGLDPEKHLGIPQLSIKVNMVFVEIHSLDNERGCYAGNKYFAGNFNVSKRQIRTCIASLKKKGFISVIIFILNERVIYVGGKYVLVFTPHPAPAVKGLPVFGAAPRRRNRGATNR